MTIARIKPEVPVVSLEEARMSIASFVIPSGEGELFFPEIQEGRAVSYADYCFRMPIVNEILTLIRNCVSRKDACAYVGIPHPVLLSWYRRNYGNFRLACDKMEARGKVTHVLKINKGGKESEWSNSAWLLERKYREEFGKDPKTVINVKEVNTIVNNLVNVVSNRLGTSAPDVLEQIAYDLRGMGLIEDESEN